MIKNRKTYDERIKLSNGSVSHPRVIVLEALKVQANEGATVEEIVTLVGSEFPGNRPRGSIGQVLSYMLTDDLVVCVKNRWYLKEHAPAAPTVNSHFNESSNANGFKAQIAPLVQKRSSKTISVFTSPREVNDVVRVTLVIKGVTVPIPLWGNMWICYGQTTPDWDAEKETYYNVETIRLLLKNGTQHEEHPSPSDTVTIAQG